MAFFTITTVNDCAFRQTYQFNYCPRVWPLLWIAVTIGNSIPSLCTFTIWRVAGWPLSMRSHPRTRMQNGPPSIIDHSSPAGGSRGGVFQKCSNIYTPPPKPPKIRGCYTDNFPHRRRRSVGALAHAWVIPNWGVGVGGVSLEGIRCDTGTVTPHRKQQIYYMRNIPDACRPPKNTVRSWYVLVWSLYRDKPYGAIISTTIKFRAYNDNNKL